METSGIKYVKSKKGMLRIGIISIGFLTFILVVSAPYCEGALLWVALAFLLSAIASLGSFILSVKAWTQKIQIGIPYQDVDIYLSTVLLFNSLLASSVLAINARTTVLWIVGAVFGFGMVGLYIFELLLSKKIIPENLKYMKTRQGTLKTAIFVLGCVTFSLLEASTFRCYYPDGCDVARIWVFAAFLYCWVGSSLLLLLRLSWLSSGISRFDTIEFTWSAFCCVNYLTASLVLSAYLKCIGFAHFDCRCRLMSNLFGYLVACLYGFDVYLYIKSKEDSDNVINSTEEN